MAYNKKLDKETEQKTIRMPVDLIERIENLAIDNERDFSKQVIFMLKEYIRIKDVR